MLLRVKFISPRGKKLTMTGQKRSTLQLIKFCHFVSSYVNQLGRGQVAQSVLKKSLEEGQLRREFDSQSRRKVAGKNCSWKNPSSAICGEMQK